MESWHSSVNAEPGSVTDDREGRLLPLLEDQLWRSGQNVAKWRDLLVLADEPNSSVAA
jgi:hypothetical protein